MKHFVVCGTSGVGKTYLEEYLESQKLCVQLPKYFDRPQRPHEPKNKNISLSRNEWALMKPEFFFTLSYNGFNYGWRTSDLQKDTMSILAITLDSLEGFMKKNKNFLPILLWVEEHRLDLLTQRMRHRGDSDKEIEKRLTLAKQEILKGNIYIKIVENYNGWIVHIKDDSTIYKELIPKIKKLQIMHSSE